MLVLRVFELVVLLRAIRQLFSCRRAKLFRLEHLAVISRDCGIAKNELCAPTGADGQQALHHRDLEILLGQAKIR